MRLNTIYLKLDPTGPGPQSLNDMTLHAALPNGMSLSFPFKINTPTECSLVTPLYSDQLYGVLEPLAGYDPPTFTYPANCPTITYTNTILSAGGAWISNNSGSGKLVEW